MQYFSVGHKIRLLPCLKSKTRWALYALDVMNKKENSDLFYQITEECERGKKSKAIQKNVQICNRKTVLFYRVV